MFTLHVLVMGVSVKNRNWRAVSFISLGPGNQFSSAAQSCLTLCDPMDPSTPGFPVHHELPEPTQTHVHRVGDAIQPSQPYCPLLLSLSIFPSIRVFSSESALCIRWPKYWSFSFNISPSKEHLGLIAFRMDWLDLLAVQGTLKSLLQHHSSKASILQRSTFSARPKVSAKMLGDKRKPDMDSLPSK